MQCYDGHRWKDDECETPRPSVLVSLHPALFSWPPGGEDDKDHLGERLKTNFLTIRHNLKYSLWIEVGFQTGVCGVVAESTHEHPPTLRLGPEKGGLLKVGLNNK